MWQRWLAWDPVRMVDRYADALRGAAARSGSTRGRATTTTSTSARRHSGTGWRGSAYRTTRSYFELFDATHAAIDYRYPMALAWLAQRLAR